MVVLKKYILFYFLFLSGNLIAQDYFSMEFNDEESGFVLFNQYQEYNKRLVVSKTNGILLIDSLQNVKVKKFEDVLLSANSVSIDNEHFYSGYSNGLRSRTMIKLDKDFDLLKTTEVAGHLDTALYYGYNFVANFEDKVIELATYQDRSFASGDLFWIPEWTVYDTDLNVLDTLNVPDNREIIVQNARFHDSILYIFYKELIKEEVNTSRIGILKYNSSFELIEDVFLFDRGRLGYTLFNFLIHDNGDILHADKYSSRNRVLRHKMDGSLLWEKTLTNPYSIGNSEIRSMVLLDDGIVVSGKNQQNSTWRRPSTPFAYDAGWIAKLDFNGKVIWEHVLSNKREDNYNLNANLSSVFVSSDNSIYAAGTVKSRTPEFNFNNWAVHLSPDGCLDEIQCDYDIHLMDSVQVVDTCDLIFEQPRWVYHIDQPQTDCILTVEVKVIGDTLINYQLASILAMYMEDTLVENSQLIVSKEVGRLSFYEDDQWWIAHDLSNSITYGDTMEYYVPKNAQSYMPNTANSAIETEYRGPYYAFLDGGGDAEYYDDSTYSRKFLAVDITNEIIDSMPPRRTLDFMWDHIGPLRSLFGKKLLMINENVCHAQLVCFSNSRFKHQFVEGGCNIITNLKEQLVKEVSYFPSPTQGIVYLNNSNASQYQIISIWGDVIMEVANKKEIDLSNFPSGIYYVRGFDEKGVLIEFGKVLKI